MREALEHGDPEDLRRALDALPEAERTPAALGALLERIAIPWIGLRRSAWEHSAEKVRILAAAGADVDARDAERETLLHRLSVHNTCSEHSPPEGPIAIPGTDRQIDPREVHDAFLGLARAVLESGASPAADAREAAERAGNRELVALLDEFGAG